MKVTLNKYGFYSLVDKPSSLELKDYYEKKYYQNATNNYEQYYSEAEILYFKNKIAQKFHVISGYIGPRDNGDFLDIGCGEGWALQFFKEKGWNITGLDYSNYGCEKFNPGCTKNIVTGDIGSNLSRLIESRKTFDIVWLDNVLEHVLEPQELILNIRQVVAPHGLLVIEVPNDFSLIQQYLLQNGAIDREFWVAIPDHISYFNRDGLANFMQSNKWDSLCFLADYPIDWNLLNPDTNYVMDKTKGKNCHFERIQFENLLHMQDIEKILTLYKSLADVGLGRQITGFFQPIN